VIGAKSSARFHHQGLLSQSKGDLRRQSLTNADVDRSCLKHTEGEAGATDLHYETKTIRKRPSRCLTIDGCTWGGGNSKEEIVEARMKTKRIEGDPVGDIIFDVKLKAHRSGVFLEKILS